MISLFPYYLWILGVDSHRALQANHCLAPHCPVAEFCSHQPIRMSVPRWLQGWHRIYCFSFKLPSHQVYSIHTYFTPNSSVLKKGYLCSNTKEDNNLASLKYNYFLKKCRRTEKNTIFSRWTQEGGFEHTEPTLLSVAHNQQTLCWRVIRLYNWYSLCHALILLQHAPHPSGHSTLVIVNDLKWYCEFLKVKWFLDWNTFTLLG